MHKDADACHPANGANVLNGEAWSSDVAYSGTYPILHIAYCSSIASSLFRYFDVSIILISKNVAHIVGF